MVHNGSFESTRLNRIQTVDILKCWVGVAWEQMEHQRRYVCSWHSLSLDAGILKCWDSDPSSGEDAKLLSSLTYFNLLNW